MHKISDENFNKLMNGLANLNLAKISFCDFIRFAEERKKEIEKAREQAVDDLDNKKVDLMYKLGVQEDSFKTLYETIRDLSIPDEVEDKSQFEFDDKNRCFIKREVNKNAV